MNVLITGGSKGIGFSTAQKLSVLGCNVIISGRNTSLLKEAASKIGCDYVKLDLDINSSFVSGYKKIAAKYKCIDILINNAGVLLDHMVPIHKLKTELLINTIKANLVFPFAITNKFINLINKSRHPKIINVSSGAGQMNSTFKGNAPAYSISKAALNMYTQLLNDTNNRIIINSICPGWCNTDMGRIGGVAPRSADDGAGDIVWLALEAPRTINGKFIMSRKIVEW
jgi:NAD(P)-dependent dehydrogenase (short-subunit alcohol dehydrogenase family)